MIDFLKRLLFVITIIPAMFLMTFAFVTEAFIKGIYWVITGKDSGFPDKSFNIIFNAMTRLIGYEEEI